IFVVPHSVSEQGPREDGNAAVSLDAEGFMRLRLLIVLFSLVFLLATAAIVPCVLHAGTAMPGYKVLAPIRHGNLTIFPVVAAHSHSTQEFLTLDEGLRSGEVVVSVAGSGA